MTETTHHTPADMRERVDVPGLPDGITPLTGVFTTHHAGRPHAIVLWQGAPWLVWQHPDGHWVTEAKVQVAALLRIPRVREPREYDTATEAIREAQARADREGRTAFVWYRYCARWAVRDTEPTEADYAEGWMLAARAPARRSRR